MSDTDDGAMSVGRRISNLERDMRDQKNALVELKVDFARLHTRLAMITGATVLIVTLSVEVIKHLWK